MCIIDFIQCCKVQIKVKSLKFNNLPSAMSHVQNIHAFKPTAATSLAQQNVLKVSICSSSMQVFMGSIQRHHVALHP